MRPAVVPAVLAAAFALAVAGCSSAATPPASQTAAPANEYPITVTHALGDTVIESKPERVATVTWGNHDVALALGVVPVGMGLQTYGVADGSGMHEWTAAKLKELGGATPVLFDETDGINFEAVNETSPDVILAGLSGITEEEYKTLSEIAPTIAYPGLAWGTTWRDAIKVNSAGMGLAAEGDALIASLEGSIAEGVAKYPQLQGKTATFFYINPTDFSAVGVYTTNDARTLYLADLGMPAPESVKKLAEGSTSFYTDVSAENVDQFDDIDIIVTYGDATLLPALQADPLLGTIPAVKRGSVVLVEDGGELSAAVSPPSALSLTWSLDEYLGLLAAAADKVS